jgi:hypothetical protein
MKTFDEHFRDDTFTRHGNVYSLSHENWFSVGHEPVERDDLAQALYDYTHTDTYTRIIRVLLILCSLGLGYVALELTKI